MGSTACSWESTTVVHGVVGEQIDLQRRKTIHRKDNRSSIHSTYPLLSYLLVDTILVPDL
jgi:hypothetical protein